MRQMVAGVLLMSGCFALDLTAFSPCETRDECAPEQVCASGYCVLPNADVERCGDGKLQEGEQCDDGNREDTDACRNNCQNAVCGDGVARTDLDVFNAAYEACDDGDDLPTGICSSNCHFNCISMWFDGEKSVVVNEGMAGAYQGAIVRVPQTLEFWLRPDFPEVAPFDWTLFAKQRADTGYNLRIDIKRGAPGGAIAGLVLIYPISGLLDEQPKATIQLPQNGWFHLAFTFEVVDGRTVIIPYVNGLPGDSFRVEGMTDFENQSGDAYIGQRPGQLEAQEHRYRGAFAGMSIHERVEYADQFHPQTPFGDGPRVRRLGTAKAWE